ncbi:MAG: sodium-dependent transporter [Methanobrevibacter sp.]|nr:sodium-dependent transporter [Methanobrevibacter sp.]
MVEKNQWDSPLSFVLAMIGAAVGLGNIWRYSYVLYSNGGGAFFIPYLVAIGLMGIPFLILEYGIGFSFKDSFTNIFKKVNPKLEILSWMLVLFVFIIVVYYMVIISWDFVYLCSSINFAWGSDPALYFEKAVGGSSNLSNMTSIILPTLAGVIILWAVTWAISHRDLSDGIGKISKILIPALFVIMAIIIVYSITLPGAGIGISTLLHPNWMALTDVNIWLAAFSQVLFSLSMGQAIALSYASYLPKGAKLIDNVFIVVASNSLFEVCTAFGVFSVLGYMSSTSGTPMVNLITEGTGLIFVVFPTIFNIMGPVGHIFAPVLFIAILFAGITSVFGIMEPMVNSTMHKLNWTRKKAVTVLSIVGCLLSLLFTTGISSYLLGIVDGFINNFCLIFFISIQCIVFTWLIDIDEIMDEINENSGFKVGKIWKAVVKYILPIFLFVMWAAGVVELYFDKDPFKLAIYGIILVAVVAVSIMFTRIKSDEASD